MSNITKAKIVASIKIRNMPAGEAVMSSELTPILGPKKIDMKKFLNDFNNLTAPHKGKNLNITLQVMSNGINKIKYKFVSTAHLILNSMTKNSTSDIDSTVLEENNSQTLLSKKQVKAKFRTVSGSSTPGSITVGTIKRSILQQLADLKAVDMNTTSKESVLKSLIGTAQSMGIEVI